MSNNTIGEFEQSVIKFIEGTREAFSELQAQMIEIRRYVDIEKIPNIGITLNNKLNELRHQFQDSGLSMYSEKQYDLDIDSYIGEAIIFELLEYVNQAVDCLTAYVEKLKRTTSIKVEKVHKLNDKNLFKRFFARLKHFFSLESKDYTEYDKEETDLINSHLSSYIQLDKKLFEYTLEKHIVGSILKRIDKEWKLRFNIPGLLIDSIFPALEKLGLSNLEKDIIDALSDGDKERISYSPPPLNVNPSLPSASNDAPSRVVPPKR